MATQHTSSLSGIYRPHWLVQWNCHCSCMHIPVHSPWLPIYIDVTQTTLIILTMAGLFPDRQRIPWNGIAGVYGCFIFKLLRNLHIFFLSYFTNFHSTSSAQEFSFLHILSNIYLLSFNNSISSVYFCLVIPWGLHKM